MRRLLIFLFCLPQLSLPIWGQTPGIIQSIINDASNNRTTPSMNVTSGNLLVACTSANYTTLTSTPAATWTLDKQTTNTTAANIFHAVAPSTGALTITEPGDGYLMAAEFQGLSSTTDGSNSSTNNGALSTTLAVTTSVNGSVPVGCIADSNGVAQFFTQSTTQFINYETADGGNSVLMSYMNTGVAGSWTQSWKMITTTHGAVSAVAFQPTTRIVTTQNLPDGVNGGAYSQQLNQVGGAGAITWTLSAGSLPGGLSLSSAGVISGTPSGATGTFNFTVSDGVATKNLSITTGTTQQTISVRQSMPGGTFTFGTPVNSGNCILVSIYGYGRHDSQGYLPPDNGSAIIDTLSTVYHRLTAIPGGNQSGTFTWIGKATSSGSDTISFPAYGLGTLLTFNASEVSGMQCGVIDQGTFSAYVDPATPGHTGSVSLTTTEPNEWAFSTVAISTSYVSNPFTPSAGYTLVNYIPSHGSLGTYKDAIASPGSTSVSYTFSTGANEGSLSVFGLFPAVTGTAVGGVAQWSEVY